MRVVYLDKIDIDRSSALSLRLPGQKIENYLLYFVTYGVVAEQVIMQGSAALKSLIVQEIFQKLKIAFCRDEAHDFNKPIYSFALSGTENDYFDYIKKRLSKIGKKTRNAEVVAYRKNHGLECAIMLDEKLKYVGYTRRKKSASQLFKRGVLIDVRTLSFSRKEEGYKFKKKAVYIAKNMEVFQSFEYIKLMEMESNKSFYKLIRTNYLRANAMANDASTTFDSIHFKWINISNFLAAIGILSFLKKNLDCSPFAIFYLRMSESFNSIKDIYFKCQTNAEIQLLLSKIKQIKKKGKYKALLKESPSALISLFFTGLNEAEIGNKAINKAAEMLAKATASDTVDMYLEEFTLLIHSLEKLDIELKSINRKLRFI